VNRLHRWFKALVLALGLLLSLGLLRLAYYIIGPTIDDQVGILTSRDVKAVLSAPTDSGSIESRLRHRLTQFKCEGRHLYGIWQTFVSCAGTDERARYVAFYWEVDTDMSPKDGSPQPGRHITALTRDTALLTPMYRPEGVALLQMPIEPSMIARAIYDGR
jgi:hypothetical protein